MRVHRFFSFFLLLLSCQTVVLSQTAVTDKTEADPARLFLSPPENAKPGVLWMWMGSNISKAGITKDLEALKREGFNRTTMFSLADAVTPWSDVIGKSPTPHIISWTEPWWQLVRFAAQESRRLGMDFGMFNCPGYETSGGPWISPELSMQELCWSHKNITGDTHISLQLQRPTVDPHANMPFPVYDAQTGLFSKIEVAARKTYYQDIVVLALPATGIVPKEKVMDISAYMKPDGQLDWDAPAGDWTIYRFGHTTMGALIQPAQPEAIGLECDKMSETAVAFHMDHVIGEIQKHLGDLIGTGFTHVHFDSYEAGEPTWTPKMREEFQNRRGYDIFPFLPAFAGRIIETAKDSAKFGLDFDATVKDLYRDIYFTTVSKKLKAAHLTFLCEPYGGPWRQEEVMPLVADVMAEFWTDKGAYTPYETEPTIQALRKSGQNIIEAEAFTGQPEYSQWIETPQWLKPIGDAAFCVGVNRMVIHRFAEQAFPDKFKPGITMGRWGTHFDRTQTWWKPAKAAVKYWQRCQAILQWGLIAKPVAGDFTSSTKDSIKIKAIHRKGNREDIYFVANLSHESGTAVCSFNISGMQPELWDPVAATMRDLPQFSDTLGITSVPILFDDAQSYFIVFRRKVYMPESGRPQNFSQAKELAVLKGGWQVQFDSAWGGPAKRVSFDSLQDWTLSERPGIKYFSGTATYYKTFRQPAAGGKNKNLPVFLDLGRVKDIVHVTLNNKDLGVIWTAPWRIQIPAGLLKPGNNQLVLEVSNVWANRLIGDEQEPADCSWMPGPLGDGRYLKEFPDWFLNNQPRPSKGRYCFTTWNYFTKDSPLSSSGLLGPVRIMQAE